MVIRRCPVRLNPKAIPAVAFWLFVFVSVAVATSPNEACNLPQEFGDACPGLVRADFYDDGKPTLALVLIVKRGSEEKAELVVAHEIGQKWRTALLDTAESS